MARGSIIMKIGNPVYSIYPMLLTEICRKITRESVNLMSFLTPLYPILVQKGTGKEVREGQDNDLIYM